MEQPSEPLNSRKRAALDIDGADEEEATAKRACSEASSASPHLSLLQELCDLEGEDEGASIQASLESSPQEDLVAEMMKSLEKVIEGEEMRGEREISTGQSDEAEASAVLDFNWNEEEVDLTCSAQDASLHEDLLCEGDLKENVQIRQLLQASDDELGLPLSSSSSDLEEAAFHEQWASLENGTNASESVNWFDASFNQFDDAPGFLSKEMYEPLLLF